MGFYGELMGIYGISYHLTKNQVLFPDLLKICHIFITVIVIGSTTVLWFFCGRLLPHPLFDPSTFSGLADLHFIGRREVLFFGMFVGDTWEIWMGKWMGKYGWEHLRDFH